MSTHLYCIVPGEPPRPVPRGLVGIDDERVRAMPIDDVVAWVSDVDRRLAVSVAGIRAHDAVVEAALETGVTPVPARFGQRFDDDDACRGALESRAASIEALLAGVQGYIEMTLIITPSTSKMLRDLKPLVPEAGDANTPGAGREYLETLRAREAATGVIRQAIDELAQRLTEAARRHVHRSAVHEQFTRLPLRTLSHLIPRDAVEPYKETLRPVPTTREFRFLVIGPRAPYSFCALNAGDGGAHGMKLAD
ncbi:MAG TPA: GvpL/GvpF family gas vesicle protein [Gemmatimonadaceae bacterium]|nr:GvpL/GvpF family gas vesicle protein [Gemmatimonadaceae bacterium]